MNISLQIVDTSKTLSRKYLVSVAVSLTKGQLGFISLSIWLDTVMSCYPFYYMTPDQLDLALKYGVEPEIP
jgi:uncharacterized membrane protein